MPRPDLFKSPILVVDTETTGFPRDEWSRVVEIGAVVLDVKGYAQESWSTLVKPDLFDERASGAVAVHGITRETVEAEGLTTSLALEAFGHLVSYWFDPGTAFCTSFNVAFDRPMIARMGPADVRWAPCIMERAMSVMGPAGALPALSDGKWKWPRLSEAADFFGVHVEGTAHRALTDARVAAEILVALRLRELGVTHTNP